MSSYRVLFLYTLCLQKYIIFSAKTFVLFINYRYLTVEVDKRILFRIIVMFFTNLRVCWRIECYHFSVLLSPQLFFFCGMLPSPTFCVPSQFVSWSVRPLEPPSTSLIDELVRRGVDVSAIFDGTTLSFAHHVGLDNNSLVIRKIGKSYVCHLFCQCFFVTLRCISSYSI